MRWQVMNAADRSAAIMLVVFPATLVILFVVEIWEAAAQDGIAAPLATWQLGLGLGLIVIASLVVRDLFPRTVLIAQLAAAAAATFTGLPVMALYLSSLVALCTVVARSRIGWAIAATASALGAWLTFAADGPLRVGASVAGALIALAAAAFGRARRHAFGRARQLEHAVRLLDQARNVMASQALQVERSRIAWELHDIVAHGLALIAIRASVARSLMPMNQDHVNEAILVIESAARESLDDMRRMVRALRCLDGEEQPVDQPQPGLWQLDELLEAARSAGLQVELIQSGTPRPLPSGRELTAYRIVQEALSNVLKHAGAARTTVKIGYLSNKLVVEVFNEAPRPREVSDAGVGPSALAVPIQPCRGLISMRERASLYGGTLHAGEVGGGFEVTAEIPVRGVART